MLVLRMIEEQFHRDVEGRPIREGRTPKELLQPGEIELRRCPYPGSRFQNERPMNMSALRQTSAHWDEIVDAMAFLRTAYGNARGGYRPVLMDIWRVGQIGSSLPWFYILHENTTCPSYAAALSKATLGVGIWGHRVFVDMLMRRQLIPTFTAEHMLDTAEQNLTLLSDVEVCAASDKMMLKFFAVLTDDAVRFTGSGEVSRLVAVRDELLRFGSHYVAFKQWMWLYWLARRCLYRDLAGELGTLDDEHALMNPTGEPYDFFVLDATLPVQLRGPWFRGLAGFVEPFSPDGSDVAMRDHALRLADVIGGEPPHVEALAADVAQTRGLDGEASARVARAIATYVALDALHGEVLATVERGFRGEAAPVFDASMRDRTLRAPPRRMFAALAPTTLPALAAQ
jgi:hypothetical protein